MEHLTTGNEIVDAVSKINFQGDITPRIWRKTITKANGKPYPLARDILSDLVYWYRAMEIVDEETQEVFMKKKFRDDLLYKTYEQLSEEFGESKRVIRDVLKRLEELGVIKRHFRTITYENGMTMNNIMYIELIPSVLFQLTYPDCGSGKEAENSSKEMKSLRSTENGEPLPPSDKNVNRGVGDREKKIPPGDENVNRGVEDGEKQIPPGDINVTRVVTKMSPYTENTTEINNNYYNNQNQSIRKKNISGNMAGIGNGVCPEEDRMDGRRDRPAEFIRQAAVLENRYIHAEDEQEQQDVFREKEWLKEQFLIELPETAKETYPLAFVKSWYEYNDLLDMCPHYQCDKDNIDGVMSILYDTLNTAKTSIRISGEDKPASVVIGKLLKLSPFDILYALQQFHSQTTRIHNQRAYLLTILYLSKEQGELDIKNKVMYDMYGSRKEGTDE